jgi:5'-deoxynucleotidase YfbR-like HD superfamily hydrolase
MVSLFEKIRYVDDAGRVKRYHTEDIDPQLVNSHSWGVAQLVRAIYPDFSKELLCAALDHDLEEKRTGDIPYPTKVDFPALREILLVVENAVREELDIYSPLAKHETHILKAADGLELMMYCLAQMRRGNRNAEGPFLLIQENVRHHALSLKNMLLEEPFKRIQIILTNLENNYVSI